ncbi:hypothetical protein GB864_13600, partial [Agromyces sp. MMS17-SY077]|nr:hypothetical protein [Agromyces seonyuensis]
MQQSLEVAATRARSWLERMPEWPILPTAGIEAVEDALGRELPAHGEDPAAVVARLADAVEPGLIAMQSPRFFGWVIGGTLPAALGADWLVSAWDQNTAMRSVTPGVVAAEELAGRWILDLLGLPEGASVGFTTGATMAGFAALAAARDAVLERAGVRERGDRGGPRCGIRRGLNGSRSGEDRRSTRPNSGCLGSREADVSTGGGG